MTARVGVVLFPGTNCEYDVIEAVTMVGGQAEIVWHGDSSVGDVDAVVIPGGFAHGDYLRPGAIARFSPIMDAIRDFARAGGPVVGICNGFQILTEAGLLPGVLQKNRGLKHICAPAVVRVSTSESPLTRGIEVGTELALPISHREGNYTCSPETLAELQGDDRIVFRYVNNPNGSTDDIAGICSADRNVVGLMPHPDRAMLDLLGSSDGRPLMQSLVVAAAA